FVILRAGNEPGDDLVAELRNHVAELIGPIAKPKSILFTEELPKTRSGKIMRRLLRDVAQDQALGDTTTLADVVVVDTIRDRSGSTEEA
ncbi:MAG: AMP-binding enzyme, partial [Candidatus Limnocylindrales bacterium]